MPITNNAFQQTTTGHDIYLMVIDTDLDSLVYATYLGGDQRGNMLMVEHQDLIKKELSIMQFVLVVVVIQISQ